jgi:hypothetical protein
MREQRFSVDFAVRLQWQPKRGGVQRATGRCLDLSPEGMRVELRDALETGGQVLAESDEFGRMGHAMVRYCRRENMRYMAGLRFSTPFALGGPARQTILDRVLASGPDPGPDPDPESDPEPDTESGGEDPVLNPGPDNPDGGE